MGRAYALIILLVHPDRELMCEPWWGEMSDCKEPLRLQRFCWSILWRYPLC